MCLVPSKPKLPPPPQIKSPPPPPQTAAGAESKQLLKKTKKTQTGKASPLTISGPATTGLSVPGKGSGVGGYK